MVIRYKNMEIINKYELKARGLRVVVEINPTIVTK